LLPNLYLCFLFRIVFSINGAGTTIYPHAIVDI